MKIISKVWLLDITDWCRQQQEMNSMYADLSNLAGDIFSIIPDGVRVEVGITLVRDVISWRHSQTTDETLHKKVIARQFARDNTVISAGADPELNTTNTENGFDMIKEAQQKK